MEPETNGVADAAGPTGAGRNAASAPAGAAPAAPAAPAGFARRSVLRGPLAMASFAVASSLAACEVSSGTGSRTGASRTGSPSAADPKRPPGGSAGSVALRPASAAELSALSADLDGSLVRPGKEEWEQARLLYNSRFDELRPAGVVFAAHSADIRTALDFARERNLAVSVRSGGHSYAGFSSGNGRLVIDVSGLDSVRTDGGEAVIGAGARLLDVYRTLETSGVTVPGGSCPTVGIAGLALGGGHGVLSRAYGLTSDNLTAATLVTADGKQITADRGNHPDLFWALRGAGNGNFGVVTQLRFRTHPAAPGVTAFMSWPASKAEAVLTAWQEWGPAQVEEIWSSFHLEAHPGTAPEVRVSVYSLGTYGGLQNAVDRLADRIGASASSVSIRRRSHREAMDLFAGCAGRSGPSCKLPGSVPGRGPQGALDRENYAARSDFYDRSLPPAGVRAMAGAIRNVRGGFGSLLLTALGGRIDRVGATDTAFVHRGNRFLAQYLVSWEPGNSRTAGLGWLDETWGSLRRYASGSVYQNYSDPELKDWRQAYFGRNAPRLAEVKKTYDPARFFSYAQGL